jgi:hypothetical protein
MVRKAILELYMNVKIRSQEEIQYMTESVMEKERKKLNLVDSLDIIDYIKQSVEILMHMRQEEFDMFKSNWETQEKLRKAKMKDEKDKLKKTMLGNTKEEKPQTKLFEKVKFDLLSDHSSSVTSLQPKLDKQAEGYEQMLIKLENDVR